MSHPPDLDPARLRSGDPEAVSAMVRGYTGDVLRWVGRWADGPDDADDLVQEVWAKVVRTLGRYRGDGSLRGWLHRVARSVCADRARRRSGRCAGRSRLETRRATEPSAVEPPSLPGPSTPERALADLPARQREVVTLRVLDGLSTRETAEAMGCAEGTVKATLSHALEALRRRLEASPGSHPLESTDDR